MRFSPQQHMAMAKLLRKKAARLVPTRAKEYRLMANTFQALAVLAARRRGQVPAGGARAVQNRG